MSININSTQISALLQLYPMAIPGAETNVLPAEAYHLGIPLSIHSPSIALYMVIDPVTLFSTPFALGDSVRLWVNGQATSVIKPIKKGEENDPIEMELPWGTLKDGANTLFYRVTRVSGNFDDSTPILKVLFNNPTSGITVSHPASIGPGQPATFTLTRNYPREYDVVTLTVGTWSKTIPYVHPANPVTYNLTAAELQQIGDGTHPVSARVIDQLTNNNVSATSSIVMSVNQPLIIPKLISVLDATGNDVPEGSTTSSTSLTLHGEASPGRQVEIYDGSGPSAVPKGKVTADPTTGKWVLTITVQSGARRLYAKSLYHPTDTYSNVRNLTVVADIVVAFLNGPYTVPAGGQLGSIELSLTQNGQPIVGSIKVMLPQGTTFADGTSSKEFMTSVDGKATVSGVKAGSMQGVFSVTASADGMEVRTGLTITAAHGPAAIVYVGPSPWGLARSADGSRVYVPVNGKLQVIDTQTSKLLAPISVPELTTSWGMAFADGEKRAVVLNNSNILVMDIPASTIIARIPFLGTWIASGVNSHKVYVSNFITNTLAVIDTNNFTYANIPVGSSPRQISVSPDGSLVCVAHSSNAIAIVDTLQLKVIKQIPVGFPAYGVVISPDRQFVYASGGGMIKKFNISNSSLVWSVSGHSNRGLAINHSGTRVYSCQRDDAKAVTTIDANSGRVVATTSFPPGPMLMEISKNGEYAYVTCLDSGIVSIVLLESMESSSFGAASQGSGILSGTPTDLIPNSLFPGGTG